MKLFNNNLREHPRLLKLLLALFSVTLMFVCFYGAVFQKEIMTNKLHEVLHSFNIKDKNIWSTRHNPQVSDIQESRKSIIEAVCQTYPYLKTSNVLIHGEYFPCHKYYYCPTPKLGTTFFGAFNYRAFQCNAKQVNKNSLKNFPTDTLSYMNSGDPYERLFSAYVNKLYKPDLEFWDKLGSEIVKSVRKTYTKGDGYDVTFREIVQFVVESFEAGKPLNSHLTPIHRMCNPCQVHFDYIGRKETMSEDIVNLLDIMKEKGNINVDVPVSEIESDIRRTQNVKGTVSKLYKALQKYPNIPKIKLFQRHWSNYLIRGYILREFDLPFNTSAVKTVSRPTYETALVDSIYKSSDHRDQLKLQRREALLEAYRSVPLDLMSRLSDFVKYDCLLFGYDQKPAYLFDRGNMDSVTKAPQYLRGI